MSYSLFGNVSHAEMLKPIQVAILNILLSLLINWHLEVTFTIIYNACFKGSKQQLDVTQSLLLILIPYGTKFLQGKILMNGHLENIDKKNFDEFHNVNDHIY